ncbi:MAG: DUF6531 domain-containing protein [Polyangiaceae bacterium]
MDLVSGAVVDKATDLEIPGLVPLVFRRYYSSLRHSDVDSTLGAGWSHSFDQRIVPVGDVLALRDGEGRYVRFAKVGVGQSTFHRRERMTLTRSAELEFRVYAHEQRRTSVFAPARTDGPAVLRRIEDNHGNAVVFEYRGDRLARVVDTAGRAVNVAWQKGRITSLAVSAGGSGFVVGYEYGRDGCLVAVRDPRGSSERYRYDRLRRMVATTTRLGTEFVYEYDGDSPRCVASYGPKGLFEVHLARDPERRVTATDGEEPRLVSWNELGLAERLQLPDGTLLDEIAYDDDGLVIAQANGAGQGYKYWHDDRGRRIQAMDPCQQVTSFEYEADDLVRVVAPDGHATRYSYDDRGSLLSMVLPWGESYFLDYDERGRLTQMRGPLGPVVRYEYDAQNNVVAETNARGERTTFRHDALGRPIAMRDGLGHESRATYDACGNRVSVTRPDGATTTFAYDAAGHVSRVVDPQGRETRYEHTGFHGLSRIIGADGGTWTIERTRDERIKKIVNPVGEEYAFERDLAGYVVAEATFDGRELRYERDGAGRVARTRYPDGTERSFVYDRAGRLLADATAGDVRTFVRDPLGRLVAAAVEAAGERDELRFERD